VGRTKNQVILDILSSMTRPVIISKILRTGNVSTLRCRNILEPLISNGLVQCNGKTYVRTRKGDLFYFRKR